MQTTSGPPPPWSTPPCILKVMTGLSVMGEARPSTNMDMSITILNCNSLNLTNQQKHFDQKIAAITSTKSDILLLSDIRLGEGNLNGSLRFIQALRDSPTGTYNAYYNSSRFKRGVAILISNKKSYTINEEIRDQDENILALHCNIDENEYLICAIYGPNNTCRTFYRNIEQILERFKHLKVIIGGDWNTVWDQSPVEQNIDILNMQSVPNKTNGTLMYNLAEKYDLVDPFRALYPSKRAYTYMPFGNLRQNRSRLDFFCISSKMINLKTECAIATSKMSKIFDHKHVTLTLNKCVQKNDRNQFPTCKKFIKNCFLDHALMKPTVKAALLEVAYHSRADILNNEEQTSYNRVIQESRGIYSAVKEVASILHIENPANIDMGLENRKDHLLSIIREFMDTGIDIDFVCELPKKCDDSLFFDALTERVKEKVSWLQKNLSRMQKAKKIEIEKQLKTLADNYENNQLTINSLERQLTNILDAEIEAVLSLNKASECLNSEKPTERFLSLVQAPKQKSPLSKLKDNEGNVFKSDDDRDLHITNFYKNLYRKDSLDEDLKVEDYLGPSICEHKVVVNSKLTDNERAGLEMPLTISELDRAVEESNKKSASGIDGYSAKFIHKFWCIFRKPFFQSVTFCINTGNLTDNFKTAYIKLLPKKGDISKIKNWRPISLLSNFYKILSRAINNRLKKVVDRVLGRSQKGFNPTRLIHEVILNTCENIHYCKKNNITGCIVAVDQSKAFDSVAHSFIDKTLEFFGFGNNFRNMVKTIGTNRKAQVLLDNGTVSEAFDLEKGTAQGDCPSPLLYNICAQILLFKIELTKEVKSVYPPINDENVPLNGDVFDADKIKNFTNKNESFADDSNTCTKYEFDSLNALKNILDNFGKISGLKCNTEKTAILRIGNKDDNMDPRINQLGFKIADEITLLGFTISDKGLNEELMLENIKNKIIKIKNVWGRFFISLPGKISIAKTLLVSQLSYYCSIIRPPDTWVQTVQKIIDDFCINGLNIGKNRLYRETTNGGLGLINIDDFITALHCSWFKKIELLRHDNWRISLHEKCRGIYQNLSSLDTAQLSKPLQTITNSLRGFLNFFNRMGSNIRGSNIFENELITVNNGNGKSPIDKHFFSNEEWNTYGNTIRTLTFDDICTVRNVATKEQIEAKLNILLDPAFYGKIRTIFESNKNITRKEGAFLTLGLFMQNFKKGSKPFRKMLQKKYDIKNEYEIRQLNTLCKKFEIVQNSIQSVNIKNYFKIWTLSFLSNDLKTFYFKMTSNSLGVGSRVAHFNPLTDPTCTFCRLKKMLPAPLETFEHLFVFCPITNTIVEKFFSENVNEQYSHSLYFFGRPGDSKLNTTAALIIFSILKFCVWQKKLKNKIPTYENIMDDFRYQIDIIFKTNKKLEGIITGCGIFRQQGRG